MKYLIYYFPIVLTTIVRMEISNVKDTEQANLLQRSLDYNIRTFQGKISVGNDDPTAKSLFNNKLFLIFNQKSKAP